MNTDVKLIWGKEFVPTVEQYLEGEREDYGRPSNQKDTSERG